MISQERHPDLGALNDNAPANGGVSNTFTQSSSSGLFVEPSSTVDFSADSPSTSSSLTFLDRTFAHITSHSFLGDRDGVRPVSFLTTGHVDCLRDSTTPDQWTTTKHAEVYKVFVQKDIDLHLPHLLDAAFVSTILMIQHAIEGAINTCNFHRLPSSSTLVDTATLSIVTDLNRIQPEVDKMFQSAAVPDYAVHILFDIPFFGSYIQNDTAIQVSGLICVEYYRAPWTRSTKWNRHSDIHLNVKEGFWFMAAKPSDKYSFEEPHPDDHIPEMHNTQHSADYVAHVSAIQESIVEPSCGSIGWDTIVQHNTQALDIASALIHGDPVPTTESTPLFSNSATIATYGIDINDTNSDTLTISNSVHHLTAATPEFCDNSWGSPANSWSCFDQSLSHHTPRHQREESSSSTFSYHRSQASCDEPFSPGEFTTTNNTPEHHISSPGIIASGLKSLSVSAPIPIHTSQASNNDANHEHVNHPGVQQRRFFCTVEGCDKSYPRKSNMQDHLLTHDNTNRFPCLSPLCLRTFARERDRNRHNTVHKGWRWKCDFCYRKFTRHDSAKQHSCRSANGRSLTFQYMQFANANAYDSNDNNDDNNSGTHNATYNNTNNTV